MRLSLLFELFIYAICICLNYNQIFQTFDKEVFNHPAPSRLAMMRIYIIALAIFMPSSSLAKNLVGYSNQNQKISGGEDAV